MTEARVPVCVESVLCPSSGWRHWYINVNGVEVSPWRLSDVGRMVELAQELDAAINGPPRRTEEGAEL